MGFSHGTSWFLMNFFFFGSNYGKKVVRSAKYSSASLNKKPKIQNFKGLKKILFCLVVFKE